MSVKNFVQCGLVTPVAANTVELMLVAPTASYQYPPLDGGTLVIADSVARPTFYEIISYTHRIDNVLYGVVRAKEGTTARSWSGSTWVYQALTAADYVDALALKAPLASPVLTGVPLAPTAPLGTNTQQIATMAAVQAAIAALIESSPAALNTLNELATALGNDPNFASTMNTALAGKEPSIAAGTSAQMWLGNKTWASVLTQVQNTLLTGLGAGSNATILTTDTLIGALAKIQNQLNNKAASTDARLTNAREWTATEVTQVEAEAGTATIARKWTALRVWQAVLASSLTGLNLTVGTAVAAADTVLVAIGKLQKQITDAGTALAGNVRATVLTGYLVGTNADITNADTVLTAFGKAQAQINALESSKLASGATAVAATTLTGLTATIAQLNYCGSLTSNAQTQLDTKAPLASPALTGVPTAPTPATATDSTQIATTAYVQANCALQLSLAGGTMTGKLTTAAINSVMGVEDLSSSLEVRNVVMATGDAGLAMMAFHAQGRYAIKMGLRDDGYFGIGGGTRAVWSWYSDPSGNMVAAGNVSAYSDPRLKEKFEQIQAPLELLKKLDGGTFVWKEGIVHTACKAGKRDYGILADQVEAVMPEIVSQSIELDGESYQTVDYSKIVPVMIEAIKELSTKIDKQAREIAELRAL